MGQQLSNPSTVKDTKTVPLKSFSYTISTCQGHRPTNEDCWCFFEETFNVVKSNPSVSENGSQILYTEVEESLNLKIYGVFDGHGGAESSKFVAENLPKVIVDEFKRKYIPKGGESNDITKIIKNAFLYCDYVLSMKGFHSGTTAIVAIIINNQSLYVCNAGDSRCVMSASDGVAKNLSFDHKPNNLGEKQRITNAGDEITANRIIDNGSLALSRAFGDFSFKKREVYHLNDGRMMKASNYERSVSLFKKKRNGKGTNNSETKDKKVILHSEETSVICVPDIIELLIDFEKHEFLVLGCDGIWDTFKSQDLISRVHSQVKHRKMNLANICENAIDHILNTANYHTRIGFDNMTIMVVAMHSVEKKNEDLDSWYDRISN